MEGEPPILTKTNSKEKKMAQQILKQPNEIWHILTASLNTFFSFQGVGKSCLLHQFTEKKCKGGFQKPFYGFRP